MGVISENLNCYYGHIQFATYGGNSCKPFIPAQPETKEARHQYWCTSGSTEFRMFFADHSESWDATCSVTGIHPSVKLGMGTQHLSQLPRYSSWQYMTKCSFNSALFCEHFQVSRALSIKKSLEIIINNNNNF